MKRSSLVNLLVLGLALAVGGFGCKHRPKGPTPIPGQKTAVAGPGTEGRATPPGGGGLDKDARTDSEDLKPGQGGTPLPSDRGYFEGRPTDGKIFEAYTVYFDYDRHNVKPDQVAKVQAVADFFKSAPAGDDLVIEGHCDERGTDEYNRALGERRALAVREMLTQMGLAAGRIRTISYGKDKPVVDGHSEDAWSKNRRGQFLLLLPKDK
jgi:peptidoglycan-associated lipoprotein